MRSVRVCVSVEQLVSAWGGAEYIKKGVELHKSHYKCVLRSVNAMGDIKYSIGPDRYLAVSKWEGKTRINLREYTRYEGKDTDKTSPGRV